VRELTLERDLSVDHSTLWRWVQRYAPVLNQRLRRDLRHPNGSWRVDETHIRLGGRWAYLYRAVDSTGDTIDFMLSPNRDLVAARHFLQLALSRRPRVINVDGHPAYAAAISELNQSGELGRRCRCRPCPYLNNIVEHGPPIYQKEDRSCMWFRTVAGALNVLQGFLGDAQGQVGWLSKRDIVGQVRFVDWLFGLAN
jgi:transposase-like protein